MGADLPRSTIAVTNIQISHRKSLNYFLDLYLVRTRTTAKVSSAAI